jgi:hypothetical protein
VFETEHARTQSPIHQTAHTDACKNTSCCIYSCLPENERKSFETCMSHKGLNIHLENCTLLWFLLCNFITMYVAKNEIRR